VSELVKAAQRVVESILRPWLPGDTPGSAISEIRVAAQLLKTEPINLRPQTGKPRTIGARHFCCATCRKVCNR